MGARSRAASEPGFAMCWAGSGGAGYSRVPACIGFLSPLRFALVFFPSILAWIVRSLAAASSAPWAKRPLAALRESRVLDCVMARGSLLFGLLTSRTERGSSHNWSDLRWVLYAGPRRARLFLFRNLLAFFACLGEGDRDGLLAAFHRAALAAFAALGRTALIAVHFVFDVAAGATRIFSLPFLGHGISSKHRFCSYPSAAGRGGVRHGNGRTLLSVRYANNLCDRNRLPARRQKCAPGLAGPHRSPAGSDARISLLLEKPRQMRSGRCQERRPFGDSLWRPEQILVILASHGLADPIGHAAGRDRKAHFQERLKQCSSGLMGAVLVADNNRQRHLAIRRHATFGIGLVEEGVHALQDALGDTRRLPEPDWRADHQDVGVQHALAQHRPRIVFAFVRRDPRLDVVVDGADDLALGAMGFERVEQLLQQHVGG